MHRGYIKLWRRSFDSAVWQDEDLWRLFCLCLMKATHKETFVSVDGNSEPIKLTKGQFVTGRFMLHKEFYPKNRKGNKSPLTIWRKLEILQKLQNLNIKAFNKYSIITINNWEQYQQQEQGLNNRRTTDEQQVNTYKNDNNNKNKDTKKGNGILFAKFWKEYPVKIGKKPCSDKWKKRCLDRFADKIITDVQERKEKDRKWIGGYVPNPLTYINQDRWEDEIDIGKPKGEFD